MNGKTVLAGEAICSRIREFRNMMKWSQEQLADRTGLSQYRVSRLETLKSTITYSEVELFSNVFGLTLEEMAAPETMAPKAGNWKPLEQ